MRKKAQENCISWDTRGPPTYTRLEHSAKNETSKICREMCVSNAFEIFENLIDCKEIGIPINDDNSLQEIMVSIKDKYSWCSQ